MGDVDVVFPQAQQVDQTEPTVEKDEVFLQGGEKYSSDKYKIDVPDGKFAQVIVKCIVKEITQEAYEKAAE